MKTTTILKSHGHRDFAGEAACNDGDGHMFQDLIRTLESLDCGQVSVEGQGVRPEGPQCLGTASARAFIGISWQAARPGCGNLS